jgi:hypothetical protein
MYFLQRRRPAARENRFNSSQHIPATGLEIVGAVEIYKSPFQNLPFTSGLDSTIILQ